MTQEHAHRPEPPEASENQVVYDVCFGIVAPVLCYLFDPVVFQSGLTHGFSGPFYAVRGPVCGVAIFAMASLAAWLAFGRRWPRLDAALGGAMVAGAVLAFAMGLVLVPFVLVGLLMGLFPAVLGMVPFFTFGVFRRHGRDARASGRASAGKASTRRLALVGVAVVVALSLAGRRAFETCLPRPGLMAVDGPAPRRSR